MKTDVGRAGAVGKAAGNPSAETGAWLDASLLDLARKPAPAERRRISLRALRMPSMRAVILAGGSFLAWAMVFVVFWVIYSLMRWIFA